MENPQELKEWISVLWSIGSKGVLIFVIIYYREAVTAFLKAIASWLTRK